MKPLRDSLIITLLLFAALVIFVIIIVRREAPNRSAQSAVRFGFATDAAQSAVPDKLIIQHGGMRITLDTALCEAVSTPVEGAYLEFEKGAIDHIVCFLGSLHHQYVKLHIHKDLIFRIVAGGSETEGFIQSRTMITFYCGHCA